AGAKVRQLPVWPGPFAVSRDDRLLVGRGEGGLVVWELDTGRARSTIRAPAADLGSLTLSADAGLLTGTLHADSGTETGQAGQTLLWRVETGEQWTCPEQDQQVLAAAADGRTALTGVLRPGKNWSRLQLWDVRERRR